MSFSNQCVVPAPSYFALESEGDYQHPNCSEGHHWRPDDVPLPLLPNQVVTVFRPDEGTSSLGGAYTSGREGLAGAFQYMRESKTYRRIAAFSVLAVAFFFIAATLKPTANTDGKDIEIDTQGTSAYRSVGGGSVGAEPLGTKICKHPDYRDTTLKLNYEQPYLALWKDTHGEVKFEASDITIVNNTFYVVFDNSWAVGKIGMDLHPYSRENVQLGSPTIAGRDDSQWEAIVYNPKTTTFWITREAIAHEGTEHFHAVILEVTLDEKAQSYRTERSCSAEFLFTGGNKGFEGMVGLFDESGEMHLIGLCEGNHCAGGARGQDAGNGRLVIMSLHTQNNNSQDCVWKTTRVVKLPPRMKFVDYSAVATRNNKIAVTSQENAQLWISEMEGVSDTGIIDVKKFAVSGKNAQILNFPRDDNCNVVYCNIEGIQFINDNVVVAVSDKMKGSGRQDFRCLAKDQSIHVFSLP